MCCAIVVPSLPTPMQDDDADREGTPLTAAPCDTLALRRTGLLPVVVNLAAATGVMNVVAEDDLSKTDTGNERAGSAATF